MLGTILGVLAVIGRILLIILLIALILILLVLLVPIRYQAVGDGEGTRVQVDAKASWLLHFLSVEFGFSKGQETRSDGTSFAIKVFGIDPIALKAKLAARKKEKAKEEKIEKLEQLKEEDPEKYDELKEAARKKKEAKEAEKQRRAEEEAARKKAEAEEIARAADRREKLEIYVKQRIGVAGRAYRAVSETLSLVSGYVLQGLFFVLSLPVLLTEAIGNGMTKLFTLIGKASDFINFLNDPRFQRALGVIILRVKKLLKHILPRKMSGQVEFGFDDPGTTGTVLAAASAFFPYYGGQVSVNPDFEEKKLNGDLNLQGKIVLGYIVYTALRVIISRDVRYVYKCYKGMKEESKQNG